MLILVTNDDGVRSPGIRSLAVALGRLGRVVVVAPDRNRSAVGHALTLERPLRAEEIKTDVFAVDGTPSDCVNLGVHGLLHEKPQLVVSGINRGGNLGDDITYSGTVCAAMEASLMGLPAFAVSLDCDVFQAEDLSRAAGFAAQLAEQVLQNGMPSDTFLNVNVPPGPCRGVRVTRQGKRKYGDAVTVNQDPRGRHYYWIGGGDVGFESIPGSDCDAVHEQMISVTPLHANLTNDSSFSAIEDWSLTTLLDKN
ncbi:5'-nucleotidase /3'-nucleotidase /exopolyphosphatase [Malonomonas rubra DSM 5091]|uniref:5'-nucleotidase SurE n=1 Tax=Malonomonas rubra DSM 5091 TaxID=1122189 RepID=A0A1M6DCD6_MALRU|nr:5'/3'-nucleotidase SurE [Malonomonas rubra]SHI70741.1 5'-nucleotidase /3'-nucleotidase /exopolyphosphatase [Malonomonas rubra DSM 5091]